MAKHKFTFNSRVQMVFRKDILASTEISLPSRLILSSLLYLHYVNDGNIEVSMKHFMEMYGLTLEQAEEALSELESKDFIKREITREGNTGNIYKIVVFPIVNSYFPQAVASKKTKEEVKDEKPQEGAYKVQDEWNRTD